MNGLPQIFRKRWLWQSEMFNSNRPLRLNPGFGDRWRGCSHLMGNKLIFWNLFLVVKGGRILGMPFGTFTFLVPSLRSFFFDSISKIVIRKQWDFLKWRSVFCFKELCSTARLWLLCWEVRRNIVVGNVGFFGVIKLWRLFGVKRFERQKNKWSYELWI